MQEVRQVSRGGGRPINGSRISEGSIGSPEPHNLSMSPLRALSPPPTTQRSYSRYSDDHHNIPSNSTLPREPTYDQRPGEQQPLNTFHPLYDTLVEQYDQNHIYNRGADDSRDHFQINSKCWFIQDNSRLLGFVQRGCISQPRCRSSPLDNAISYIVKLPITATRSSDISILIVCFDAAASEPAATLRRVDAIG
ncbi:hypothetical protein E2C01_031648 [Portunus trituberculatus]|uniref:Uncharacterized protein n=1 Tax=Portunus trituberculatus TaxID=210409 RepID=A0A5B7F0M5_PORTR|nr:hypothetical protein [Portunus trituberculatus]